MKLTHQLRRLILSFEELNNSYSGSIKSSAHAESYIRAIPQLKEYLELQEVMIAIFLNNNHIPLGYQVVSIGHETGCFANPKIICAAAILSLSQAVIVVHNHPSGKTQASEKDRAFTKNLVDALKLFDIRLLDSLILTKTELKTIL